MSGQTPGPWTVSTRQIDKKTGEGEIFDELLAAAKTFVAKITGGGVYPECCTPDNDTLLNLKAAIERAEVSK